MARNGAQARVASRRVIYISSNEARGEREREERIAGENV